jgi:hypothetical protein
MALAARTARVSKSSKMATTRPKSVGNDIVAAIVIVALMI